MFGCRSLWPLRYRASGRRGGPFRAAAEIAEDGELVENVWDYPRPPAVAPCRRHVRVELAGQILADSDHALRVLETSHPPTIYIPPDDVRLELPFPAGPVRRGAVQRRRAIPRPRYREPTPSRRGVDIPTTVRWATSSSPTILPSIPAESTALCSTRSRCSFKVATSTGAGSPRIRGPVRRAAGHDRLVNPGTRSPPTRLITSCGSRPSPVRGVHHPRAARPQRR